MTMHELLENMVAKGASDLHLLVGYTPVIRVDGNLMHLANTNPLTASEMEPLVYSILTPAQKEVLINNRELDFSYQFSDSARFRVNAYNQRGNLACALRYLPFRVPTIEELNLPGICHNFATMRQGFIIIAGPTGHGKSTTLAAIINEINLNRSLHVITIEDPIEYVYPLGKSMISQREMLSDTFSWDVALRSALREDPDVILVGEMRDFETIAAAITLAETGHLVFATLHTNDAAQTVDRIVDVFPENQQAQVRLQLSNVLEGIISQRLIPKINGGRVPACEIMLGTPAVKSLIREGKSFLIPNTIQTSGELGMCLLEKSLADWVKRGEISLERAQEYSLRPEEVVKLSHSGKKIQ